MNEGAFVILRCTYDASTGWSCYAPQIVKSLMVALILVCLMGAAGLIYDLLFRRKP